MTTTRPRLRRKSQTHSPSFTARSPNIPPYFSKVPWEDSRWETFHKARAFNEVRDGEGKIIWPWEK